MGEIDDDNKEENVKHEKPLFFVFVVAKFFSYRMKMEGRSGIFVSKENMHKESHHQKKEMRKWHASDFVHHFYYSVFFVV